MSLIRGHSASTRSRVAFAAFAFALLALAPDEASACGMPLNGLFYALLLLGAELVVGPLSLLALACVCISRCGWRLWLAVMAAVNLVLAAGLAYVEPVALPIACAQAGIALAILVIGGQPKWRACVFGRRPASRRAT